MSYESLYRFDATNAAEHTKLLNSINSRLRKYLDAAYRHGYDFLEVEVQVTFRRKSELQEAKP